MILKYVICAIIGYLCGCSHMSYYISRIKGIDIKGQGSKNYGASNTTAIAGIKAGILVFVHDVLKAVVPMLILGVAFKDLKYADVLCGAFVVVGHIFPFYLKFNGGKGYASFIGFVLTLYPLPGLILFVFSIIFALLSDLVVTSTFFMLIAVPVYCFVVGDFVSAAVMCGVSILIFIKHKNNIINIATKNGKEGSIRKTLFKKRRGVDG